MAGMRADLVTVLVVRRSGREFEFLLMRRVQAPMAGTWQPIMGGIEAGETATAAALRELGEEVGLAETDPALLGVWALDGVRPFYMSAGDAVVLSPTFVAEVAGEWTPRLNEEHDAHRWVAYRRVREEFYWPGHAEACREAAEWVLRPGSLCEGALRVRPGGARQ